MRAKWFRQDKVDGDAGAGDGGAAAAAAAATAAAADAGKGQFAWSDGWREHLAGGDEKLMKRLERFDTPAAIFTSYRALEQKLSSGELRANVPFPEKGTDDEKAAWRKDAGLPDKPEAYDLKFDDGFVIGEDDKGLVDGFLKAAHEKNLPPAAVKASVRWYFDTVEKRAQDRQQQDAAFRQESEDSLRAEWGGDYRKNVNLVKSLLDTAPEEIRDQIMFARLEDGKPLTSHPKALQWLVGLARTVNPVTTVVPGADAATIANSIDDEIKKIETTMRKDRKAYNNDDKMQERYRELLGAREQLKAQRK
jgi:hypothetical protein